MACHITYGGHKQQGWCYGHGRLCSILAGIELVPPGGEIRRKLECGPMPNGMAALPNIGGALCSTSQSLADDHYYSAVQ